MNLEGNITFAWQFILEYLKEAFIFQIKNLTLIDIFLKLLFC